MVYCFVYIVHGVCSFYVEYSLLLVPTAEGQLYMLMSLVSLNSLEALQHFKRYYGTGHLIRAQNYVIRTSCTSNTMERNLMFGGYVP